jgi:very-short-patch-repair endonuclease
VQARQLSLALDPDELIVALALERAEPADPLLASFARAAEWLASKTEARVVAIVPHCLEGSLSVDPIAYDAFRLVALEPSAPRESPALVFPVVGRPHPASDAEQALARALASDVELGALFEFNQRLTTVRRSNPKVDLVWRSGQVVVELDGWETHGNRWSFASDRHRDYELALSGYVVLRLTNDEVLLDPALALDKIRDVVRLRQSQHASAASNVGKEGR